jgi:hypothetical protein
MTTEPENHSEELEQIQLVEDARAFDWFLRSTISDLTPLGVELGITVMVRGMVVSGTLISGAKYFEEMGNSFQSIGGEHQEVTNAIGESWKAWKVLYDKPEDAPDDWKPEQTSYIHLRDARIFAPGQSSLPSNQGVLWRGKLSSVDGFSMGKMSDG